MANQGQNNFAVIALVGPDGAGKSTLQEDLARTDFRATRRPVVVAGRNATVMELPTATRMLQIVDFANVQTQAALIGASPFAGAVLVVSAADSLMPGHHDSLSQVHSLHIPLLAVALTKVDVVADEEMIDLVEMEIREQVMKFRFDGDNMPIVRVRTPNERPHEGREPARGPLVGPQALVAILAR